MVKRSKIITQKPKAIENPNIFDMKSVTIEYLKTSRKLSKTIRQAKKVFQVGGAGKNYNSPLYSDFFFFDETKTIKNTKITKRSSTYKGYTASTYNTDILNSFSSELELKDTESAHRNKLKGLLTKLKEFKLVAAMVLEF